MKKRTKIVMLPTANQKYQVNEGDIFINDSRQHSWGKLEALKCERVTSNGHAWNGSGIQTYINHLYFLSDERLKSEGWGMHSETHEVFQYEKDFYNPWVYRVIATTDPELKTEVTENTKKGGFHYGLLPQPSQAFIEEYCRKGGIEYVDVEYDEPVSHFKMRGGMSSFVGALAIKQSIFGLQPKVDSNNCIIIHPI